MKHFAVFGYPIAQSLSPHIHMQFAAQFGHTIRYTREEATLENFPYQLNSFFANGGAGCNVTAPHKQTALMLAEHVSQRAALAGAANTLWYEQGHLCADNTDGLGLMKDLQSHSFPIKQARILVIGAGGAARGILGPLLEAQPQGLTLVNRSLEKAQALQNVFVHKTIEVMPLQQLEGDFDVIIHATAAQTLGEILKLPEALLSNRPALYDLSYTKKRHQTAFLTWGRAQGCTHCADGLGMLIYQAAESYFLWTGFYPETDTIKIT